MHKKALEAEKRIITARLKADQHLAPLLRENARVVGGERDMDMLMLNLQAKEEVAKAMARSATAMDQAMKQERAKAQNALTLIEARYTKAVQEKELLKNEHKQDFFFKQERIIKLEGQLGIERQEAQAEERQMKKALQSAEAASRQTLADKIEGEQRQGTQSKIHQNEILFWRTCTGALVLSIIAYNLYLLIVWAVGNPGSS
jgi:hypothetical protein